MTFLTDLEEEIMGEIISVTAGKGGVGKSVTAANLAAGLHSIGKRVILVDADAGNASADLILGVKDRVVYSMLDVLEGSCTIMKALVRVGEGDSFLLLPGSQMRAETALIKERIAKLLRLFKSKFDAVVVDAGNCPGPLSEEILGVSDEVVFVMTPDALALRSSARALRRLRDLKPENTSLLLNRLRTDLVKSGQLPKPEEIIRSAGLPLLGAVLDDDEVLVSVQKGVHIVNVKSLACREFLNSAKRLDGQDIPIILKGKPQ